MGYRVVATAVVAALASVGAVALGAPFGAGAGARLELPSRAAADAPRPSPPRLTPDAFDRARVVEGRLVAPLAGGGRAVLTLDPELQAHLEEELARYEVPFGAVVAIEPDTGRVLAHASHSTANPAAGDLALDATPPAASVFKIVTAAALVDAGVQPDVRVCWGGGVSRLVAADLRDDPARDRRCDTLSDAMGGSINTIFAKLAARNLDAGTLRRYASAFGFGHALPYDLPVAASGVGIPDDGADRLEFARTAAGFWHTHLSPVHGALLAATIANDGHMPRASLVDRVLGPRGDVRHRHEPSVFRPVVPRRTARTVARMMERTCARGGTAWRDFHDLEGRAFLPDVRVAGKTGSLTTERPYRAYSWWVGFAPAEAPRVAVAALVVNRPRWRIKAGYLAREALRVALRDPDPASEASR